MDREKQIQQSLQLAKQSCLKQDKRFTKQRKQVLALLLRGGNNPMTAYQLLDALKKNHQPNAQPATIYRALEFLLTAKLIHRLESNNCYVACDHLTHSHHYMQFLICDRCKIVKELNIDPELLRIMQINMKQYGFQMNHRALELHGLCQHCQKNS